MVPWARLLRTKAALKLHTLLDLCGSIPRCLHSSDGKLHDVNVLDMLAPESGAIWVVNRACADSRCLYLIHLTGALLVTRAKRNLSAHRVDSHAYDRPQGVVPDQTIALDGPQTKKKCPRPLRRVHYQDPDSGRQLVFLTNLTGIDALTVCNPYRSRWRVELLSGFLRQHLRVTSTAWTRSGQCPNAGRCRRRERLRSNDGCSCWSPSKRDEPRGMQAALEAVQSMPAQPIRAVDWKQDTVTI